jgi:hypothetical protein
MSFGKYLCPLALAALLAPPVAFGAEGKTAWGARVSDNYDVWAWLSEYAGEDQESWDEQEREKQDAALAKAKAGCERSGAKLAATRNQTDGLAILALTENDLGQIGVCVKSGETIAASLEQKKARLANIRAKALKGQYLEADMLWLRENNITMPQQAGPSAEERAAKQAAAAKSQKQKYDAAKQKYGKLKDQDAKGLGQLYDGGKGSGAAGDPALAADLSGAKGKLAKPGLRQPTTKSLTAAAPPAMAGTAPKPAAAPKPTVREPSYREGSASDPTIYFEDPAVKKAVAKVWAKAEERLADPKYHSDTYTSNPIAKAVYNNLASTRVKTAMAANEIMMGYRYNGEEDVKAFQKDFGVKLTQSQIADIDHFYSGASYSAIPVVGAVGGVFFSVAYDGIFDIGKGWIKSGNGRVKYNVRQVGVDTQGCAFGMALTGTDIGEGTAKMMQ